MLIAFFDSNGIIHKEFVPMGQTVNSAFYEEVLKQLLQHIHHVWPELHQTGQWMLLHNNVPAQSMCTSSWLSAAYMFSIIHHTPLIWCLRTSVSPPEEHHERRTFADVAAIQEHVTAVLRSIPKEAFADSFQKLYERCQKCVVKDGDYFEGQ